MKNLELYKSVAAVPQDAQKPISAGRLKGMTDINPMWRIFKLTEMFGPCGFGWKYAVTDKRIVEGAGGTMCAFVDIDLFVKIDEKWSDAIVGTGGSSFVANEKNGPYTSDEAFKMALTDAISVACKMLGFGADIYWAAGRTKYNSCSDAPPEQKQTEQNNQRHDYRAELIEYCKQNELDLAGVSKRFGLTKSATQNDFKHALDALINVK